MTNMKNYTYDIFISYSHIDNEKLLDQGWVEQFYKALNVSLWQSIGTKDINIWWDDKRLDGGIIFNDAISNGIKDSLILLCLNSPSYLKSDYCKKELDLFYTAQQESVGLKLGDRSRIINVLLYNIPYKQWPQELQGTSGFPFHDSIDDEDRGHPLDIGTPQFKSRLQDLTDSLVKLIDNPVDLPEEKFTIYFGDVADSLRPVKERTITDLEKQGFKIVCDIPPPFEENKHEETVKKELQLADLSVHLLDQSEGTKIEGMETMWYPQKQAELSLQSVKPQLIWVPEEMNFEAIKEEQYKTFIQGLETEKQSSKKIEYIRGPKSTLTRQIKEFAEQLKKQQLLLPPGGKVAVLLDTHYNDQLYALELSKSLLENQIQPFINPQEDNPKKNIKNLEDRISQVRTLVFLYGKVTGDWVSERMKAARQLIVINDYPIDEFFVCMLPPHKDPDDQSLKQRFFKVNIVDNSDTEQLDADTLEYLLKGIKAVA